MTKYFQDESEVYFLKRPEIHLSRMFMWMCVSWTEQKARIIFFSVSFLQNIFFVTKQGGVIIVVILNWEEIDEESFLQLDLFFQRKSFYKNNHGTHTQEEHSHF